MSFNLPKLCFSEVMDTYRSYSRDGQRRLSPGSSIRKGLLNYIINKKPQDLEKCISEYINSQISELDDGIAKSKKLSDESPFQIVRVAIYCLALNDYPSAMKYLKPFYGFDKIRKSSNIYNAMRYILCDLLLDGRISSGAIQASAAVKGNKYMKEGYLNWIIALESKDKSAIDASIKNVARNYSKICAPNQIFYCEPESLIDLWALGLCKHTANKGLNTDDSIKFESAITNERIQFSKAEVNSYNPEIGDKNYLIGSVEFLLKLHSFDRERVCKTCKQPIHKVILDANECSSGTSIHYKDQYPDLNLDNIAKIVKTHTYNEAGWCKFCLCSIGTIIREEKACTHKVKVD